MNLQDRRWIGHLLLLISFLSVLIISLGLYVWNEWMIFALFPMVFILIIVSSIIGDYWDIEVDTSTDNSSCYFCGISKSFLSRKIVWEYHDELFHCGNCHDNGSCY